MWSRPSNATICALGGIVVVYSCLCGVGITWGLPTRRVDPFLFGEDRPWSGEKIHCLAGAAGKFAADRGADVDADPLGTGEPGPIPLTSTEADVAKILLRYRLYSHQPDEMITLMALAGMRPRELQFDPKLYQYGGLFVYPVGALLKVCGALGWIDVRSDVAFYLDHPEEFGKFYVVARAYSAVWGAVGVIVVFAIARRLAGSAYACGGLDPPQPSLGKGGSGMARVVGGSGPAWIEEGSGGGAGSRSGRRSARCGDAAGIVAAMMFASLPVVTCMSHEGKPHLPGAVLMLAAVYFAMRSMPSATEEGPPQPPLDKGRSELARDAGGSELARDVGRSGTARDVGGSGSGPGALEQENEGGANGAWVLMSVCCGAAVGMVLSSWPIVVLIPLTAWFGRRRVRNTSLRTEEGSSNRSDGGLRSASARAEARGSQDAGDTSDRSESPLRSVSARAEARGSQDSGDTSDRSDGGLRHASARAEARGSQDSGVTSDRSDGPLRSASARAEARGSQDAGRTWRARTLMGVALAIGVYCLTNPYVVVNLLVNREVLRSNFGNSFAMYRVAEVHAGLVRVLELTLEGATAPVTVVGLLGCGLAVWRRREALALVVPAAVFAFQFVLIGAGKPAEYGRFGVFYESALAIGAALALAGPGRDGAKRGRGYGVLSGAALIVTMGWAMWGSGTYLRNFVIDVSGGSRIAAAQALESGSEPCRTVVTAEPAPYGCPPIRFSECEVSLVRDAERARAVASERETGFRLVRAIDQASDGVKDAEGRGGLGPGWIARWNGRLWGDRDTPISWANKPMEISQAGGREVIRGRLGE